MPTDDGESPISKMTDWVNTTCPACGGPAARETDTMPQWAGSSWYFLRYIDPKNDACLANMEALKYWLPVDWYNGGMEHTTLHLLYSRFWHKFLYDIGAVPTPEPYAKRTSHGMILGENGEKMSKSRGNVINPDDIVAKYGADTLRLYEMFIGDFEKAAPWSDSTVNGCKRFLDRIVALSDRMEPGETLSEKHQALVHKTIKKVSEDVENLKFNTAIAAMMTLVNAYGSDGMNRAEYEVLLRLLNPFAPHITEELWEVCGFAKPGVRLSLEKWPEYDEKLTVDSTVEIAVQVNGKLRGTITVPMDSDDEAVKSAALSNQNVQAALEGMDVVKTIVVKNRIANFVVRPAK